MRVNTAWLKIHFCVLLWGFTAILGKLISLPALALVTWRMLIVCVALFAFPGVWQGLRVLSRRMLLIYACIGVLVAMHWLTFYGAIKLANASVATTCLAVAPVFVAIVEPWIARRPFKARELLLGIAVVPGVMLVVGGTPHAMLKGIAIGILSAFFVALFSSLNKRFIEHVDARTMTCIEMGAGVLFLLPCAALVENGTPILPVPNARDAMLLFALATCCTLLPFVLALSALRHLSAFAAQLSINLEPVYTILLAMALLGEQRELKPTFYMGVIIVLAAVFIHPLLSRTARRRRDVAV